MSISKRIVPVLLLSEKGLYKTTQFRSPVYIGDPINVMKVFNEKEADEIVVLDISKKTQCEGPNFDFLKMIAGEIFSPIAYGGGISNLKQIETILRIGFEKVILCSHLYGKRKMIKQSVVEFGSQSIVGCIETKKSLFGKYRVYINSGVTKCSISLEEYIKQICDIGVGEIFVQDVSREGTFKGYDINLYKKVANVSTVPVIACGGANSEQNIRELFVRTNVSAAASGRLFVQHGPYRAVLISYPSLKNKRETSNARTI